MPPIAFVLTALGYATPALLGGGVVVGGAMIPDLDQRIPGVKHCGPTHTVWFALAVGVIVGTASLVVAWSGGVLTALAAGGFGFVVGTLTIAAHILADALTPTGVRPFAPIRDEKYTADLLKTANPLANYAVFVAGAALAAIAFTAGLTVQ
ncbi:metal-dependent hydrolase [Halobellus sp. Atlit-38R]|uniref:metal-dependent hydrolase n=1 Tax=Halobellus sp. Atlit-38R TaxID=2282131 RepID=UPI001F411221|nr:metal-dependent hydrolase [Halobellus sp. Atlit-38R]